MSFEIPQPEPIIEEVADKLDGQDDGQIESKFLEKDIHGMITELKTYDRELLSRAIEETAAEFDLPAATIWEWIRWSEAEMFYGKSIIRSTEAVENNPHSATIEMELEGDEDHKMPSCYQNQDGTYILEFGGSSPPVEAFQDLAEQNGLIVSMRYVERAIDYSRYTDSKGRSLGISRSPRLIVTLREDAYLVSKQEKSGNISIPFESRKNAHTDITSAVSNTHWEYKKDAGKMLDNTGRFQEDLWQSEVSQALHDEGLQMKLQPEYRVFSGESAKRGQPYTEVPLLLGDYNVPVGMLKMTLNDTGQIQYRLDLDFYQDLQGVPGQPSRLDGALVQYKNRPRPQSYSSTHYEDIQQVIANLETEQFLDAYKRAVHLRRVPGLLQEYGLMREYQQLRDIAQEVSYITDTDAEILKITFKNTDATKNARIIELPLKDADGWVSEEKLGKMIEQAKEGSS